MNVRIRSVVMSDRGQIVIPEEVRQDLNLNGRQALVLIERNNEIIIKKESEVASAVFGKTNSFNEKMSSAILSEKKLAKEWLSKKEDQAWKDL
ncbi:MAG: AbrB/MazE/SpoVT family DNA-binding domain-containing protein [Candidatus Diapherotrites archaeon]|nr:AbrB/MazE/SpoVT family DNA-binding domain-containing protein [Candidatus Diapherotrites archaeon]